MGWSETGDGPFVPERATAELRAALDAAGAARPFILVGREFGAALASSFARRYPSDTAGLVLVDAPDGSSQAPPTPSPWLARLGVLRTVDRLLPSATSPAPNEIVHAFGYRPDHLARTASEARAWRAVVSDASNPPFTDTNVRLITSSGTSAPDVGDRIVEAIRTLSSAR